MIKLNVNVEKPYPIYTCFDEVERVGEIVRWERGVSKILIVTDSNVQKLYLDKVNRSLQSSGFTTFKFVFSAGEKSKNTDTYLSVVECLTENSFTRQDAVLALGGGVVGDLAGFAAATYMRGIGFVQVPTTLLSAIDASIGGKTGVNLKQGKNLLGAFYQPQLVFCDCFNFDTLPKDELKNGLGEAVKYAILNGGEILEILESELNKDNVLDFVALCQMAKADIVAVDEKENGERRLLNLGHTFAHAIEKLSDYKISHGVAVANGIEIIARACFLNGDLELDAYDRILKLLAKYDLRQNYVCAFDDIFKCLKYDKKANSDDSIYAVKIYNIGVCKAEKMLFDEFYEYMKKGFEI